MRKLASIQKIEKLNKIKNSDFLESAKILGWNVVVRVEDFKVGDLCVYCEIDSILPEKEEFEFLRDKKYRIKTIKLRGIISQGIAFPLSILPEEYNDIKIGNDVTETLEIKKYEIPMPLNTGGNIKCNFPSFIPQTDKIRIETVPGFLEKYKGRKFYMTEKLDGTSATYFIMDSVFGICSRNRELHDVKDNLYCDVSKKFEIEDKLRRYGKNIAIQGEIVGHKVSGNNYGFNNVAGNQNFYLFNVFNINERKYFNFNELKEFAKKYDFITVPILDEEFILNHTIEDLINLSHGESELNSKRMREGIIIQSQIEGFDEKVGRLGFKVISPKFLLKKEK